MDIIRMSKKDLKFGMQYWLSAQKLKSSPTYGYSKLNKGFGTEDLVNIVNEWITKPVASNISGTQLIETYAFKNDVIDAMDTFCITDGFICAKNKP
ncbi:MAG: hypothetical protein EOO99_02535 [Pedobacter sp.]|nr:MAG: hypothetical protein EOO99_02535 [Pedobacter sp.]